MHYLKDSAVTKSEYYLNGYTLKISSRCNLNCSYCYVFNKADQTWKNRIPIMTESIFDAVLLRIKNHCISTGQKTIRITFHGGEPCLIGSKKFDEWCEKAKDYLKDICRINFSLQTNGTLLERTWAKTLKKHNVNVGISMDGPKDLHDKFRIYHNETGSYDNVVRGLKILKETKIPFGILSVIQLGADPLYIHKHFMNLGCESISYLLPDFTHDTISQIRKIYGATPCADFLIPIFDHWWFNSTLDVFIRPFWSIAQTILGGSSGVDSLGNDPLHFIFVESDGQIEGLDVLKVCEDGIANTGLNVQNADFLDLTHNQFHSNVIFKGTSIPTGCKACPERNTCGGGYLPHRYSKINGFDNPSVWCADILKLFSHIRKRLEVSPEETDLRRQALIDIKTIYVKK